VIFDSLFGSLFFLSSSFDEVLPGCLNPLEAPGPLLLLLLLLLLLVCSLRRMYGFKRRGEAEVVITLSVCGGC